MFELDNNSTIDKEKHVAKKIYSKIKEDQDKNHRTSLKKSVVYEL